jgi:hypothetical protein
LISKHAAAQRFWDGAPLMFASAPSAFNSRTSGQPKDVKRVDFADDPNDTGGVDDTLRPTEALDSDDVRNVDGDEVVDPPEQWAAAEHIAEEPEGESLDDKLAAEEPEPAAVADETDDVDHIDPGDHGRAEGQVSGAPENGDSIFPIVE